MNRQWSARTRALIGDEGIDRLAESRVLVVGAGGVGGYAIEMLARAGVGHMTIVDADCVDRTNLNRQLIALRSSLRESKVRLFTDRIIDINPDAVVTPLELFLTPGNTAEIVGTESFDLVIDAIDTVAPKVALISYCLTHGIPVISSMGAGGRMDPSKVKVCDLWETQNDGLARAIRQRLRKAGLRRKLKVVASTELPKASALVQENTENKLTSYGTIATIPSIFGIYMASEAIRLLLREGVGK